MATSSAPHESESDDERFQAAVDFNVEVLTDSGSSGSTDSESDSGTEEAAVDAAGAAPASFPSFDQPFGTDGIVLENLERWQQSAGPASDGPAQSEAPWSAGDQIHRQALLILHNMYTKLNALSLDSKKQIRMLVGAPTASKTDLASSIVAHLIGVPERTVFNVVRREREPQLPRPNHIASAKACSASSRPSHALEHLTRLALRNVTMGRPATEFCGDLAVAGLAGADIGTSHHSKNFPGVVQYLAAQLVRQGTHKFLQQVVPSLGVPSDLEVIADSGSPDQFHGRNKSTVLAVGVVCTSPAPLESSSVLLSIASEEMDARGQADKPSIT